MEHYLNTSIENIDGEIWRDISEYEGLYQVSNMGRVRSINYNNTKLPGIIKQDLRRGYLKVTLNKNNKKKNFSVHRLVAFAFIENDDSENKTQVNHKDEDKTNNTADNLEWCTAQYNINYGTHNDRVSKRMNKKIKCKTTGLVFNSVKEAGEYYNCRTLSSAMSRILSGQRRYCGKLPDGTKLEWEYIND